MRFTGKVAVITGGGQGLGSATAAAFAEEGAQVVLLDAAEHAAERRAAALAQRGFAAVGLRCDVTDEGGVELAMQEAHERFGRVDVLVNSAALHGRKFNQPFASLGRDDLRALFEVNVFGIVNCALACQPMMAAAGGGAIVNLASISANASRTPYGVSKLAVRGVTTALAGELAADNIRVNAISPGFVGSTGALQQRSPQDLIAILAAQGADLPDPILRSCSTEDLVSLIRRLQLVPRDGTVDDVVRMVLFLCTEEAGFVTGETVKVAGGALTGF